MTVDDLTVDVHYNHWRAKREWDMEISYGDLKTEFSVEDDDIQNMITENFDYIEDTVAGILTGRIYDLWDKEKITDSERAVFLEILRKVIE